MGFDLPSIGKEFGRIMDLTDEDPTPSDPAPQAPEVLPMPPAIVGDDEELKKRRLAGAGAGASPTAMSASGALGFGL